MRDTESDVLVVGAGAAGAAAAWRLARHGFRVTVLERGRWVDPADSPASSPDWEVIRQTGWNPNPNIRKGPDDEPVDDAESEIKPLYFNGVGGSTVMWSCHFPRFHPSDFCTRSLDGVGDDWPVSYAELAPYYHENEAIMGVAGVPGHPAYPPHDAPRLPPVGLSPGARRVAEAFNRKGWSWWSGEIAINTGPAGPNAGRCNGCGPCELHCPRRAKSATDLNYLPAAIALGAKVITGARVTEVLTGAGGAACGVAWLDDEGLRHRHMAPVVVLAANGIQTPRLLLASGDGAGLANRSGLVGRRLMLHPMARVTGIFDEVVEGHRGIAAGPVVSHHFYETDEARPFKRGFKLQVMGTVGPALTANGALGRRMPWGGAHHAAFARQFGHAVSLSVCSDDMPDEANRIVLSDRIAGSDGLPAAKMVYRVPEAAKAALAHGRARAREVLEEAGARDFIEMESIPQAGFHLMGTARMGEDPETSVLDRWSEAHDVAGLFVADGSAFVTAAAVNPTNTLQALALRLADRIAETRRSRAA
ncbi:GMC family oxidoreductase [Salipiger mucosus]|uniref:Glucose-methanol-choline (GMC) oxidoreductase:NAD binding protein site n=1 Tax=Salipiger mucosus DSM 16094 TaxID=1123237 RepID=S9S4L0_9RHOB|nr:GMC family oxidoreductase [Salipiger mucosus]EPX85100.1 Glucose-methanol-choline (GMC) oxidoreductase:NAD binding protein site [Salipiger mucosus DSM 16094]